MFNQDATLKQAVNMVADPFTPESKWMAACIAAGNTELSTQHLNESAVKKSVVFAGKSLGIIAITANSLMSLACCMFIAVHYCWLMTGIETDWFMDQTRLPQMAGIAILLLGTFGFWNKFSFHKPNSVRDGFWALAALGLLALSLLSGPGPALSIGCGVAAYFGMGWMGRVLRELSPASFGADKAVICKGLASTPWAAFVIWAIACSVSNPGDTGPYSAPDVMQLVFMQLFLAVAVAVPAATVARISKSSSTRACLGLNAMLHAPMLLSLAAITVMSALLWGGSLLTPGIVNGGLTALSMPTLSNLMATQGGAVVLALLGAGASYAGHTALGSWVGAMSNRGRPATIAKSAGSGSGTSLSS